MAVALHRPQHYECNPILVATLATTATEEKASCSVLESPYR